MRTRFELEELISKDPKKQLKYSDYKKRMAKELKRVKPKDKQAFLVIAKHDFPDKKKQPLLIIGSLKGEDWQQYIKASLKANKHFGTGKCTKDSLDAPLMLQLKRGKVSDEAVVKAVAQLNDDCFGGTEVLKVQAEQPAPSKDELYKTILSEYEAYQKLASDDFTLHQQALVQLYEHIEAYLEQATAQDDQEIRTLRKLQHRLQQEEKQFNKGLEQAVVLQEDMGPITLYNDIFKQIKTYQTIRRKDYDERRVVLQAIREDVKTWLATDYAQQPKQAAKAKKMQDLRGQLLQQSLQLRQEKKKTVANATQKLQILQQAFDPKHDYTEQELNQLLSDINYWYTRYAPYDDLAAATRDLLRLRQQIVEKANLNGFVINLNPGDKTMDNATRKVKAGRTKGKDRAPRPDEAYTDLLMEQDDQLHDPNTVKTVDEPVDLGQVGSKAPVLLLAHGRPHYPSGPSPDLSQTYATHFGSKTPKEIAQYLIDNNLPKNHAGVVYLRGCFTAAGSNGDSFIGKVYKLLLEAGYEYLQVKGNLGVSITLDDGSGKVIQAGADQIRQRKRELAEEREKLRLPLVALEQKINALKQDIQVIKDEVHDIDQRLAQVINDNKVESQKVQDFLQKAQRAKLAKKRKQDELETQLKPLTLQFDTDYKPFERVDKDYQAFQQVLNSYTDLEDTKTFGPAKR